MPEPVMVALSPANIYQAANAGIMRRISGLTKNRPERYGAEQQTGWQIDVEGALAEFAVARFLGFFWDGKLGITTPGDVGTIEVRSTQQPNNRLILHPGDGDESFFILATGIDGDYVLRGFIKGRDGKLDEYWKDPSSGGRPAFFVPQSALVSIRDLKATLDA